MWTYNGIRIYVTDMDETVQQIIARLQPLGSTTVLQVLGMTLLYLELSV